jgi:uncharacterized protein YodC (DUF2158 family)
MRFKCGDVVIKSTGGNKMTISDKLPNGYKCLWFVENSLNEKVFKEEEIVTLNEYKRLLKTEEREDKINQLLKTI